MCNRPWRRLSELPSLRRLCNGDSATGCAACSFSFAVLWQSFALCSLVEKQIIDMMCLSLFLVGIYTLHPLCCFCGLPSR